MVPVSSNQPEGIRQRKKIMRDCINALMFWPEKRIKQTFREAGQGIREGEELKALRIFYRRMRYFMKTSSRIEMDAAENEAALITARYEKPMLDKDIAELSGAKNESA
jgi:hypothetical protein